MTIETRTYYGLQGAFVINDPTLLNVEVIRVKRNGIGYNPSSTLPGNREFRHTASIGVVDFSEDDPFINPPASLSAPAPLNEKVMITIKY